MRKEWGHKQENISFVLIKLISGIERMMYCCLTLLKIKKKIPYFKFSTRNGFFDQKY